MSLLAPLNSNRRADLFFDIDWAIVSLKSYSLPAVPDLLPPLVAAHTVLVFFFFFALVTGPQRCLSLKLSDTGVYAPQIRARLGTSRSQVTVLTPWGPCASRPAGREFVELGLGFGRGREEREREARGRERWAFGRTNCVFKAHRHQPNTWGCWGMWAALASHRASRASGEAPGGRVPRRRRQQCPARARTAPLSASTCCSKRYKCVREREREREGQGESVWVWGLGLGISQWKLAGVSPEGGASNAPLGREQPLSPHPPAAARDTSV